ncbi:hypothetical protein OJ253_3478 [Cryptosporidium canis]|uniref:Uncharacterized protein n=1 Tax=Cryptosporidium canis TaxID=195482 RepID=A0A9D5DDX0_9CRYT|nr:hypothetical protein OJ253_3478 [Cryptosporidium canis]
MNCPKLLNALCVAICILISSNTFTFHKASRAYGYHGVSLLQMGITGRLGALFGRIRKGIRGTSGPRGGMDIDFRGFDGVLPNTRMANRVAARKVPGPRLRAGTTCVFTPPPLPSKPPVGDPYLVDIMRKSGRKPLIGTEV